MASQTKTGRVRQFKDEEGYGFIAPDAGNEDVFFHASAVAGRRRPRPGDRVRFRVGREKGRIRAVEVRIKGFRLAPATVAALVLVLVAVGVGVAKTMNVVAVPWPLLVYAGVSLVTFAFYAIDKRRAQRGGRRIREATLHALELAGGWPGALVAQPFFRHKRRKPAYLVVFWLIVLIHLGFWTWFLAGGGREWLGG